VEWKEGLAVFKVCLQKMDIGYHKGREGKMKDHKNLKKHSQLLGSRLSAIFAAILLWGAQPGCASTNQSSIDTKVQEPVATALPMRSAVMTKLALKPGATPSKGIDLRALRLRVEETGHKLLCSSVGTLKFALRSDYEAYVTDTGSIYVTSRKPFGSLYDKDDLETKLEEVLSVISDTRPDFLRPKPDKAEPSDPFAQSLYYTVVYFVEPGAPYYQSVLLSPSGTGLTLRLESRPIEARVIAISGRGWTASRVTIRGERRLGFPFRQGPSASLDLAAGNHSLDWRYSHGVCRLEFLTKTPEEVGLAGVGALDCTFVRTQPIVLLQLPACLQTTP
jgi:hypothetical protein